MTFGLKFLLTVAIALWVGLVAAQQLEVIELRSKNVDQVLPTLLPLVEPGGTLTGMNNQLFSRPRRVIGRKSNAHSRPSIRRPGA